MGMNGKHLRFNEAFRFHFIFNRSILLNLSKSAVNKCHLLLDRTTFRRDFHSNKKTDLNIQTLYCNRNNAANVVAINQLI